MSLITKYAYSVTLNTKTGMRRGRRYQTAAKVCGKLGYNSWPIISEREMLKDEG